MSLQLAKNRVILISNKNAADSGGYSQSTISNQERLVAVSYPSVTAGTAQQEAGISSNFDVGNSTISSQGMPAISRAVADERSSSAFTNENEEEVRFVIAL